MLAAAHETELLCQLEAALPRTQPDSTLPDPSPGLRVHPQRKLLLTLLFLNAVGLHRLWDLRSYTGQELARLSGRPHPYSYRHTERFLMRLAAAQADQSLTQALARWTTALWHVEERSREASPPAVYLDGHRKPVYTQTLIPRGPIGRLGKIAGCRALVLLHDDQGHPLLPSTQRGDLHLTSGIPHLLTCYEQRTESMHLANLAMWVRDRFFPATYAHATWHRLLPFFQLPGRVQWGSDAVQVEVRPFNNRQLTRDLLAVCQRVNELRPRLPDGRTLILHASSSPFG